MSLDECILHTTRLINGLEQQSFISEQQIMNLYMLQSQLIREKSTRLKQMTIVDMFTKANKDGQESSPKASSSVVTDVSTVSREMEAPSVEGVDGAT